MMAKITTDSVSNFQESLEPTVLAQQGKPSHWPPVHHGGLEGVEAPTPPAKSALKSEWVDHVESTTDLTREQAEGLTKAQLVELVMGGEEPSAGTSSSTSGSKQGKSGSSVQETEPSSPSPARTAESPSSPDPASSQAPSSTAPSTSGSTQETGASQPGPSPSSEEQPTLQQQETEATQARDGRGLIHLARQAYEDGNYDEAKRLLNDARKVDRDLEDEVTVALEAVDTAASSGNQSPSEETPDAGGHLVK